MLVEIALCNDRETPTPIPVSMWMFQTKLRVDAGGAEVFLPVRDVLEQDWPEHDDEVRRLDLQYRNRLEFAIGRTCSVDWVVREGARRATEVSTTWLPVARDAADPGPLGRRTRCCRWTRCRRRRPTSCGPAWRRWSSGYGAWLDEQEAAGGELPEHLRETAEVVLWEARQAQQRLADGLEHVATDAEALRCFQFMNRVMRDQRVASQVAAAARIRRRRSTIEQAQRRGRREGRGGGVVAAVPAGVHPDAARRADRSDGAGAQRGSPGAGGAAVLPDRWRQDRGLPRAWPRTRSRSAGARAWSSPPTGRSTAATGSPC